MRGTIQERGKQSWRIRAYVGRDGTGTKRYVSRTVRGTRRDAERELSRLLETPITMPTSFTDRENWTGGFYELAIEVGDCDDDRLDREIAAAWADPRLDGPYDRRDIEPDAQATTQACLSAQDDNGHLRASSPADRPHGGVRICRHPRGGRDGLVGLLPPCGSTGPR